MSKRNKKEEKKVGYSISEPTVQIEEKGKLNLENESTKFVVILLCIIAFIALLWLVDTLKNKDDGKEEEKPAVSIDYNTVIVGNMLDQKYDKYAVYAYTKDDEDSNATIEYLLPAVGNYYKLDLDKINNSVAVDETSNFKGTIDQIKFKGTTLLIIENGQIKEAYEGADTIIDYLRSLNS